MNQEDKKRKNKIEDLKKALHDLVDKAMARGESDISDLLFQDILELFKEKVEIDEPLQAIADYIVDRTANGIGKIVSDLGMHTLEALQQSRDGYRADAIKQRQFAEDITKKHNDFLHSHNLEAGKWSILKCTLEQRIHQLQRDRTIRCSKCGEIIIRGIDDLFCSQCTSSREKHPKAELKKEPS